MSIEEIRQITKAAIEKQIAENVRRHERIQADIAKCMIDVRARIRYAAEHGKYMATYTGAMMRNYMCPAEFNTDWDILRGVEVALSKEGYKVRHEFGIEGKVYIEWQ